MARFNLWLRGGFLAPNEWHYSLYERVIHRIIWTLDAHLERCTESHWESKNAAR